MCMLCRQLWPGYGLCKAQCACESCPVFAVVKDSEQQTPPACRAHGPNKELATADIVRALQSELQARGHDNDACILQQLPLGTRGPQNKARKGKRARVDLGVLHVVACLLLGIEVHGSKEHVMAEQRRTQPRTQFGGKSKQVTTGRDKRKRTAWKKQSWRSGALHEVLGARVLQQSKQQWCADMTQALQARLHLFLASVEATRASHAT